MNQQAFISPQKKSGTVPDTVRKYIFLGVSILSMILVLVLFFLPMYSYVREVESSEVPGTLVKETVRVSSLGVLRSSDGNIMSLVIFLCLILFFGASLFFFIKSLYAFFRTPGEQGKRVSRLCAFNALGTGLYFVGGVVYAALRNSSEKTDNVYSPGTAVPFIISLLLPILLAFFVRESTRTAVTSAGRRTLVSRIELFVYGAAVAALTVAAALSNILYVTFTKPEAFEDIKINGLELLRTRLTPGAGLQLAAFVVVAILMVMGAVFTVSLVSFITRSRTFYRVTLVEMLLGTVFTLTLGLFGKYYELVQELNKEGIVKWLGDFAELLDIVPEYEIKSRAYVFFIAVLAVVVAALIRKPYTRARGVASEADVPYYPEVGAPAAVSEEPSLPSGVRHDPCPAFSELDAKRAFFDESLAEAQANGVESVTLPALVQYIVNYARDSRLHLFYTAEDIAAFIAGLGTTRLSILQGMSGTGKTSLPKIFAEAIYGCADIVEVESSWRDKNELLGYYNEFSRTYTPKKFTQALYKAALNPEIFTFIVLDEMNLSRIEYYFSDFLSLMEHEEDKRAIKLLNVPLYREGETGRIPYAALTDGHTLRIPKNVWFIGTANRDESTFEISDKVYDRAHTMNFNRRAAKVAANSDPLPRRYVSVSQIAALLEAARAEHRIDVSTDPTVRAVEELLLPYNISFGNRIAGQIESFVSIYCACFAASDAVRADALERILLSKVVSKLELKSIENKELLAEEFAGLGLMRCHDFILKLSEE